MVISIFAFSLNMLMGILIMFSSKTKETLVLDIISITTYAKKGQALLLACLLFHMARMMESSSWVSLKTVTFLTSSCHWR